MKTVGRWMITVLVTVLTVVAVVGATSAFAQEPEGETPEVTAPETRDRGLRGRFGIGGPRANVDHEALLADALGITVEELEAARTAARQAAIDEALAEGRITQEQADRLQESGRRFHRHGPRGPGGDGEAPLADALGITVEELEAAQAAAKDAALDQMVADEVITQEQADLARAATALREYIDREALLADALGVSVEEIEAARGERGALADLIEAQGLDRETLRERMAAAYEAAVADAVADGVITQAQADQLQEQAGRIPGLGHGHGRRGPRGFDRGGPGFDRGNPDVAPGLSGSDA